MILLNDYSNSPRFETFLSSQSTEDVKEIYVYAFIKNSLGAISNIT